MLFETRINSGEFDSSTSGHKKEDVHPTLRVAMVGLKDGTAGRVVKVLNRITDHVQPYENWRKLFKILITYVYELHQAVLMRSGMTPPAQRLQHSRLFIWLLKEIFQPGQDTLPVLGIIQKPYPDWKGDRPFARLGRTQIELIDYFSGDGEPEAAGKAVYLVATYQHEYPDQYSRSIPSSRIIRKDPMAKTQKQVRFEKCLASILNRLPENLPKKLHSYNLDKGDPVHQLINSYRISFEQQRATHLLTPNKGRTLHPSLPLAGYFPQQMEGVMFIEIIDKEANSPVRTEAKDIVFPRILKFICKLHLNLLNSLDATPREDEQITSVKELCQWFCQILMFPNEDKSLPIMGPTKVNDIIAPWEDFKNEGRELFEPVQLQLVNHFSGAWRSEANLKFVAGFMLATFYQEFYPSLFNHLIHLKMH
ncbi:hypothetical protein PtB15_13B224 [Puccinia triticina]|nr:hypothetical protein PtB15_13B224 [Puccinia triticina]